MHPYRRVTKAEDAKAWRANRFTRAAPGKFRSSSKTISERQFVQKAKTGGLKKETYTKQRRQTMLNEYFKTSSYKGILTKQRNKEIRLLLGEAAFVKREDSALITKYVEIRKGYVHSSDAFKQLSKDEQNQFRELFVKYPADLVRTWLGSSEESRAARFKFAA